MIVILPFELLGQIANDLSQHELLSCMCVCHDWYNAFISILYDRVILSNGPKQFQRFVEALERSPDLQDFVRAIQWSAEILSSTNVNAVACRCHNINSMVIAWTSRTCLSPLSVSLETFPILTRLKLEYHGNGLGPKTAEYGSAKLASFLTSAPRLLALSLVNVIPLVRCIELISIHKACAELEHLDITCVHWDAKMTDIRGIGPFPALQTLNITNLFLDTPISNKSSFDDIRHIHRKRNNGCSGMIPSNAPIFRVCIVYSP
ncbi:hypothetical protein BJV82DRAFT_714278 [Fennellomyces sp. T-0311]|nr:hypothetical protein BJV82DRAFT_714278 [Fennellomyces sp. T-0311]